MKVSHLIFNSRDYRIEIFYRFRLFDFSDEQTFALTHSDDVRNQLALIWGVAPLCHEETDTTEKMLKEGEKTLLEAGAVENGETLVMMAGRLSGLGLSSSVVVWTVGEDVPRK